MHPVFPGHLYPFPGFSFFVGVLFYGFSSSQSESIGTLSNTTTTAVKTSLKKMNLPSLKLPYNMICWPETHHLYFYGPSLLPIKTKVSSIWKEDQSHSQKQSTSGCFLGNWDFNFPVLVYYLSSRLVSTCAKLEAWDLNKVIIVIIISKGWVWSSGWT